MLRVPLSLCAAAFCLVATAGAQDAGSGDPAAGKTLFHEQCVFCHADDSAEMKVGPGLAGVKDRKLANGKDATRENLMENLNKGTDQGMPPFEDKLSEEQKNNVIAYVLTL